MARRRAIRFDQELLTLLKEEMSFSDIKRAIKKHYVDSTLAPLNIIEQCSKKDLENFYGAIKLVAIQNPYLSLHKNEKMVRFSFYILETDYIITLKR